MFNQRLVGETREVLATLGKDSVKQWVLEETLPQNLRATLNPVVDDLPEGITFDWAGQAWTAAHEDKTKKFSASQWRGHPKAKQAALKWLQATKGE